MHISIRGLLFP